MGRCSGNASPCQASPPTELSRQRALGGPTLSLQRGRQREGYLHIHLLCLRHLTFLQKEEILLFQKALALKQLWMKQSQVQMHALER